MTLANKKLDVWTCKLCSGAAGITVRDMRRQKPFRKFDKRTLEMILTDLVTAEYIALVDTRAGQPGRSRVAYVAIDSGFG